MLIRIPIRR